MVHSEVRLETYVLGKTLEAILDAFRKVDRAPRAGRDAAGARTSITNVPGYLPIIQDKILTEIARADGRALLAERGDLDAGFMGGSFDVGDISHLIPVLHLFVGGTRCSLHNLDFMMVDYEAAVVLSAKLMAMCVVDLPANGAREAIRVKEEFQPRLSTTQYLEPMRQLIEQAGDLNRPAIVEDGVYMDSKTTIRLTY